MAIGGRIPRRDCAFANRLARIRHDPVYVEFGDVAKTFARRTSPQRAVEAQPPGLRIGELAPAIRAFESVREIDSPPMPIINRQSAFAGVCNFNQPDQSPVALSKGRFQGIAQSLRRLLTA